MLGKLTWDAIPLDQPIPLVAGAVGRRGDPRRPRLDHAERLAPVSLEGVDHQRRPQAYRDHVHPSGDGDAAARLLRRDHDAIATGNRIPIRRLSASRTLQPDLLGARHADDLLRRNAVRDRADEPGRAAAAWRPRRGVSDAELGQLLAHRHRRAARQHFAGRGRVRAHRLAAVSSAVGDHLLTRRRRRLLSLVAADLRRGDTADRRQLRHHDTEDSRPRHDLHAHAGLLLDDASPPT